MEILPQICFLERMSANQPRLNIAVGQLEPRFVNRSKQLTGYRGSISTGIALPLPTTEED
jgi:hypothetical protein